MKHYKRLSVGLLLLLLGGAALVALYFFTEKVWHTNWTVLVLPREQVQRKCTQCPSLDGVTLLCMGAKGTRCAAVVGHCALVIEKKQSRETVLVDTKVAPILTQSGKKKICSYQLLNSTERRDFELTTLPAF